MDTVLQVFYVGKKYGLYGLRSIFFRISKPGIRFVPKTATSQLSELKRFYTFQGINDTFKGNYPNLVIDIKNSGLYSSLRVENYISQS
jgi:hypothetical protein